VEASADLRPRASRPARHLYRRADLARALPPRCTRTLPRAPANAESISYSDDLYPVRSFVAARAEQAGLTPPRISDLVLAVSGRAGTTTRLHMRLNQP